MESPTASPTGLKENSSTETHRLIIFNSRGTAVLLQKEGEEYHLPRIRVAKFMRSAQEVTGFLLNYWHLRCLYLFSALLEGRYSESDIVSVLESIEAFEQLPEESQWVPIHAVLSQSLLGHDEQQVLQSAHVKAVKPGILGDPEPFARIGWLQDLKTWISERISPLGIELRTFEQLNGSESFCLIRFDTTEDPIWFKAVGPPNLHEYQITQTLAHLFPACLPRVLAIKDDWHGWLMADGGRPLREITDDRVWTSALIALGKLQLASIHRIPELATAGCRDLRMRELERRLDPFIGAMREIMARQHKTPPKVLVRSELMEVKAKVREGLHCMESLQMPDTLGYSDFNPGNILVRGERCLFIDWAEAHLGHPFLTFEYFLAHVRKDAPDFVSFENEFRDSYCTVWSSIASKVQIAEALRWSPLIAVYAYAVSGDVRLNAERLKVPGVEAYLRSLTRRMKQEADAISSGRPECLN